MFKKLTIHSVIVSSIFLCSCDSSNHGSRFIDGESTTEISGMGVHPDFQLIVDRFVVEANKRGISVNLDGLDIQYGDTDGAYGVCYLGGDLKDIVIDPSVGSSSYDFKSEIILHELGHCILDRDHNNNPNSLMHATRIIGEPWRTEILDELFAL